MKAALQKIGVAILLPAIFTSVASSAVAPKPPDNQAAVAPAAPLARFVKTRVHQILADAEERGDLDVAAKSAAELFDQVTAYARDSDVDSIREADYAVRLIGLVGALSSDEQKQELRYLRTNDELARAVAFLIKPGQQQPAEVYAVLKKLREKNAKQIDKYPNLAAAISVVHARRFERHINENKASAPDPTEIFDYYVKNESRMFFGVKAMPAELLVWVVDTTASVEEMNWALDKYGGDKRVGARFFDIKYDYDNFKNGTPKKITSAGFTLQNIFKYGGVCADQAYFAMEVGKAIGVPTAYDVGSSAETGHAWVGFLQADAGKGWWNFDIGRYSAYKGVRGTVHDPQSREGIPDSQVSVLAELIGTRSADRQAGVALTDAAVRLISLEKEGQKFQAVPFPQETRVTAILATPRKGSAADSLSLIELALKQNAGYPPAWFAVRDLAKDGKLTIKDKRHWADLLQRLGGPKYPDFTLSILAPMIETVSDFKEQNALWNATFTLFQKRFDLAASIRMSQAANFETQKDTTSAGGCYMDVIDRYSNAGPFVIDALKKAEALLKETGKGDKVVTLYEQTWSKITPPREMNAAATAQSNWYRVGTLYAKKLQEAGDAEKSKSVLEELKNPGAQTKKKQSA
ncbi:MAG TPA: hypothetical protein VG326_06460 [Tepidisphaeraceae bacterium]|jgi:hypothetical protein|nr:hypothetical protein [Tepidisphaeraceae bacterium]